MTTEMHLSIHLVRWTMFPYVMCVLGTLCTLKLYACMHMTHMNMVLRSSVSFFFRVFQNTGES